MKKFIFSFLSLSLLIATFTGSAFAAEFKIETKVMPGDNITIWNDIKNNVATRVISGDYDNMQTQLLVRNHVAKVISGDYDNMQLITK